jgi:hypothetical protein
MLYDFCTSTVRMCVHTGLACRGSHQCWSPHCQSRIKSNTLTISLLMLFRRVLPWSIRFVSVFVATLSFVLVSSLSFVHWFPLLRFNYHFIFFFFPTHTYFTQSPRYTSHIHLSGRGRRGRIRWVDATCNCIPRHIGHASMERGAVRACHPCGQVWGCVRNSSIRYGMVYRVWGIEYRVWDMGYRVYSMGYRV